MSEESLQLRSAREIIPQTKVIKPFMVSRNTLLFCQSSQLNTTQLNVIMNICKALQHEIIFGDSFPFQYRDEVVISICLNFVSGCHTYKDVMPSIIDLAKVKISYSYEFKGMATNNVNLISSVEYCNGSFLITVSGATLPWYLFCGKGVGFAKIETNVFFNISSPREKKLYSYLVMYVDSETMIASKEISIQELRTLLGYSDEVPFGRINARVILPLIQHLKDKGSCYALRVRRSDTHSRRGRPATKNIIFELNGAQKNEDSYEDALRLLSDCYNHWPHKDKEHKPMNPCVILKNLGGDVFTFFAKCERAGTEYKKKKQKEMNSGGYKIWRANTVKKILREDYGIDVYDN